VVLEEQEVCGRGRGAMEVARVVWERGRGQEEPAGTGVVGWRLRILSDDGGTVKKHVIDEKDEPTLAAMQDLIGAASRALPVIFERRDEKRALKEDRELRKYFIAAAVTGCIRIYPAHLVAEKAMALGTDLAWRFVVQEEAIARGESAPGAAGAPKPKAKKKPAKKEARKR
jgi:hypothetical protein